MLLPEPSVPLRRVRKRYTDGQEGQPGIPELLKLDHYFFTLATVVTREHLWPLQEVTEDENIA